MTDRNLLSMILTRLMEYEDVKHALNTINEGKFRKIGDCIFLAITSMLIVMALAIRSQGEFSVDNPIFVILAPIIAIILTRDIVSTLLIRINNRDLVFECPSRGGTLQMLRLLATLKVIEDVVVELDKVKEYHDIISSIITIEGRLNSVEGNNLTLESTEGEVKIHKSNFKLDEIHMNILNLTCKKTLRRSLSRFGEDLL